MKCKYCGKSAGLFSVAHKECKLRHDNSVETLRHLIDNLLEANSNYMEICNQSSDTIRQGNITIDEFNDVFYSEVLSSALESKQSFPLLTYISTLPSSLLNKFKKTLSFIPFRDKTVSAVVNEAFNAPIINEDGFSKIREVAELTGNTKLNKLILNELENRINACLEDGLIEPEEEQSIGSLINCTGIPIAEISNSQAYTKYIQSLVLRDIQEGIIPNRITFNSLPILTAKKEYPIWAYSNVKGYEERTGRQYVGGSRGTSIRLCKGVYYRTGGSKGYSVNYQYSQELGTGSLIITNKALYFVSSSNTVKVLIPKIVSVEPYSDGIAIIKDGVRAHPLYFVGFDSWFMMNLLPLLCE